MNRRLFYLLFSICVIYDAYAQKVESDDIQNNIRRIQSKSETIDFDNFFRYNLELFISPDGKMQYFIRGRSEENEYHNFPCNSKLLLKTFEGKVIELTSVASDLIPIANGIWEPTAYYPVSYDQLQDIISGISKIRVEMLSYSRKQQKPFVDYPELEFKKDKMGKEFKEMFLNLQHQSLKEVKIKKSKRKDEKVSLERKNAASDF